eukprot:5030004-Pleurochrysis_carterae.AAC.1
MLTSDCKKAARTPFFANLRAEDAVSLPATYFHWALVLTFIVWLQHAARDEAFALEWLSRQFERLGNATQAAAEAADGAGL